MIQSVRKLFLGLLGVSLVAVLAGVTNGQPAPPPEHLQALPVLMHGDSTEKAIAVDKNVNFTLCVTEGNVKVNGWSRGEIRAVVRGGARFGFKVQHKNAAGVADLLSLYSVDATGRGSSECLWGDEIEIDAPMNATVTIKG